MDDRLYRNPTGYDRFMGPWSSALAPGFLAFAEPPQGDFLDIGCGTGRLLAALKEARPEARLTGLDPSPPQIASARNDFPEVTLVEGEAEALPWREPTFDAVLSMLVLQEFSGDRAIREMKRVTRPGGIVAACQWDFPRMPVIAGVSAAIAAARAHSEARLSTKAPGLLANEDEMVRAWQVAGLANCSATRLVVERTYDGFDDLWESLLGGSTPSTMTLAALAPAEREKARVHMLDHVAGGKAVGPLTIAAEALCVRGFA